ncbi:synembryn-A-like [Octopus sinensis]|uniref:Synembryn-A-like n=1 Tax=Octopus sinensis TaxID=2607531 RepID=A0A6P7SKJ0_9MOLL|nr:synembryn-A-like [Octopus sinensis]
MSVDSELQEMEGKLLQLLESGSDDEQILNVLEQFNTQNAMTVNFPSTKDSQTQEIIAALCQKLGEKRSARCNSECLKTIRIFSRDTVLADVLALDSTLTLLMTHAWFHQTAEESDKITTLKDEDTEVIIEAQKCLCNIIYNSKKAQHICSVNGCIEGVIQRMKTYKDANLKHDIKYFDMRLLFLLSALVPETRQRIHFELHGFSYLMEIIDLLLHDAEERKTGLTDQEVDLCCEVLKILFNLTMSLKMKSLDEEEDGHLMRLISVLRELLLCKTESNDRKEELVSHTVNLLTNVPATSYEQLLTPLTDSGADSVTKDNETEGKNMESIVVLLNFLHQRLRKVSREQDKDIQNIVEPAPHNTETKLHSKPPCSMSDNLTPILHCLCEASRNNRSIRKFCRLKVLPPMRDEVRNLPEEGDTLRNRLCQLLTSLSSSIKHLVPDFLFTLCKENVDRMIKYTGYGNCAGLLAERGLLMGGRGKMASYSSESEDSETEEYSELRPMVNPVTGRWEEERPKAIDNMSEEQKEYEAMKAVDLIHKLHEKGVIQPGCLGSDGRPTPISHILQLTENIKIAPEASSDSD